MEYRHQQPWVAPSLIWNSSFLVSFLPIFISSGLPQLEHNESSVSKCCMNASNGRVYLNWSISYNMKRLENYFLISILLTGEF